MLLPAWYIVLLKGIYLEIIGGKMVSETEYIMGA